jgi:glycosyltransferase involved in cell wall biosynthesis
MESTGAMMPVLLNWPASNFYGWGIVGLNLLYHWANDPALRPLLGAAIADGDIAGADPLRIATCAEAIRASNGFQPRLRGAPATAQWKFPLVEGLGNGLFAPSQWRGTATLARCIFEDTRLEGVGDRLAKYDLLLCASEWNASLLKAHANRRVEMVAEGIDPALFHPAPKSGLLDPGRFYIFSGGKVEFRKGHDLTLLAFKEFSRRHSDAVLVCAWHSPWPKLSEGFQGKLAAPLRLTRADSIDVMSWVRANGIDPARIIEIPPLPNPLMAPVLREMDCALAPSRAEACTNLLAKEAMACGVPVILADNTGVRDLLAAGPGNHCLALGRQTAVTGVDACGTEGWGESDVEEILAALESLYSDSVLRKTVGQAGAAAILSGGRIWAEHARRLKSLILSL